jgi:hypothetical protein
MRRTTAALGGLVLALVLAGGTGVSAADDDTDTEASVDQDVGKCVTKCEATHDACTAKATAEQADCKQKKATCDTGCGLCTRMYGPQVINCVNDCNACQTNLARSACTAGTSAGADCETALETCLERCGP